MNNLEIQTLVLAAADWGVQMGRSIGMTIDSVTNEDCLIAIWTDTKVAEFEEFSGFEIRDEAWQRVVRNAKALKGKCGK